MTMPISAAASWTSTPTTATTSPPPDPWQIPVRRSPEQVRRIEEGEAERQDTHERWRRASGAGEAEWLPDDEDEL